MAKNIIVVGGSLGGLFQAIALRRLGHNVRILERSPTPLLHDQGAGVVAGSDTQRFFERYDLTKHPLAVRSKLRHYLDRHGHVIHREDYAQYMTSWDLLYNLLRTNFDRINSDFCPNPPALLPGEGEGHYQFGSQVTGLEDLGPGAGIRVDFTDKSGASQSLTADLLIAADGGSSAVRKLLLPDVQRKYAGYVAWRGTAPESLLSHTAAEAFVEKFTFFHAPGIQILAYLIPGKAGTLQPGERLVNWVWYYNYEESSAEFAELMTDTDGQRHRVTLPPGGIKPEIWEKQKRAADDELPPQFAEIVKLTETPFIQAITDVISPQASFFDGRVLMVGDALAGFRPHTAASTSQAAFDAFMVDSLMTGALSLKEWEKEVTRFAKSTQRSGVMMGERSQFGRHPLFG